MHPTGKKPKLFEFNAEDHFFLSKLNATNQLGSITSKLFNKYTNKDYLEDQLSNPRFELKQSQIKIFVTVEIPMVLLFLSINKCNIKINYSEIICISVSESFPIY